MTYHRIETNMLVFVRVLWIFAALMILMLLFQTDILPAKEDAIIARTDRETLTIAEIRNEFNKLTLEQKKNLHINKDGLVSLINQMLINKMLLAEAMDAHIADDRRYQQKLEEMKKELLVKFLLEKKIAEKRPWIGDGDLRKYYDKHRASFKNNLEINTSHILLRSEPEARQILSRLSKGEDFVFLARQYSIDPNAKNTGGNLGFYPKGALLPEYEETAFKLSRIGQISGPVKSRFGYHIIRLEAIKPSASIPFEDARDTIRQQFIQENEKTLIEQYVNDLVKITRVIFDEKALDEMRRDTIGGFLGGWK